MTFSSWISTRRILIFVLFCLKVDAAVWSVWMFDALILAFSLPKAWIWEDKILLSGPVSVFGYHVPCQIWKMFWNNNGFECLVQVCWSGEMSAFLKSVMREENRHVKCFCFFIQILQLVSCIGFSYIKVNLTLDFSMRNLRCRMPTWIV